MRSSTRRRRGIRPLDTEVTAGYLGGGRTPWHNRHNNLDDRRHPFDGRIFCQGVLAPGGCRLSESEVTR